MSSESDGDRLSDDQWDALDSMAEWWQDNTMGRRAMLGGTAAMAGAAAFGAGRVSADPPDGNPGVIGTQNDRQDVWIDQADANSVDADQVTSRSLPTWRVYIDGSETVGVKDTGEAYRNTDAATVWQNMADDANALYNGTYKYNPIVIIDGGMEEFSLSSNVTIKEGAKIENARFEGSGVTSGAALSLGIADDSFFDGGFGAENVYVRDAGDVGVEVVHALKCNFENIVVDSAGGVGIRVEGAISCLFENVHSVLSQSHGIHVVSTSKVSNATEWVSCRTFSNGEGGTGFGWNVESGDGQKFRGCLAESNADSGWRTIVNETKYDHVWTESNGGRGVFDTGDRAVIEGGHFNSNDTSNNRGIELRGADVAIYGPVSFSSGQVINIANTTDARLWGVSPGLLSGGSGTRTRWNGIIGAGTGGADLSTTTGQFGGDMALADGTSGANAYALAVWDSSNSQWQYYNPSGTV